MKDLFGKAVRLVVVLLLHGSLVLLGNSLQVLHVVVETGLLVYYRRGVTYLRHCLHLDLVRRLLRVHVHSEIVLFGHLKDLNVLNCFTVTVVYFSWGATASVAARTDAVAFLLFRWKGIVIGFNRRVAIELSKGIIDKCLLNHCLHSSSLLLLLNLSMQGDFLAYLWKFVGLSIFLLDKAYHAFSTLLQTLLLFLFGIFLFFFCVLKLWVIALFLLVGGLITVGTIFAIWRDPLLSQVIVAQILNGSHRRRTIVIFLICLTVLFVGALRTTWASTVGFLEKSFYGCFADFENWKSPVALVSMLRNDWHVELRYLFAKLARSIIWNELVFSKFRSILLCHALLLVATNETWWPRFVKHVMTSLLKNF